LRKNNSFFSIQIDIFKLKPFQLKMDKKNKTKKNFDDSSLNFILEEKPPNWEKNRMTFMLCNSSLPPGIQLPHMLIKHILGFIPGSFEPPPPPPPQPIMPAVVIDYFDNIWTNCYRCGNLACFYVSDNFLQDINCKVEDGDIRTAICYDCGDYKKCNNCGELTCDCEILHDNMYSGGYEHCDICGQYNCFSACEENNDYW
jgi:hypothetical protein